MTSGFVAHWGVCAGCAVGVCGAGVAGAFCGVADGGVRGAVGVFGADFAGEGVGVAIRFFRFNAVASVCAGGVASGEDAGRLGG